MYKRHQSVTLHNGEQAGSDFLVRVIRLDDSDRLQLPGDVGDFYTGGAYLPEQLPSNCTR